MLEVKAYSVPSSDGEGSSPISLAGNKDVVQQGVKAVLTGSLNWFPASKIKHPWVAIAKYPLAS